MYMELYQAAEKAVQEFIGSNPSYKHLINPNAGTGEISYNLSMTSSAMGICPRRSEGLVIPRETSEESGFVALNGTMLAGTLMVKSPEEWKSLQTSSAAFDSVLEAIGIPKTVPGHL
jgi:sulfate adenylyltransferase (ADP) / ATP adenylyltransferase